MDATTPPEPSEADEERIDELVAAVAALQAELRAMRESLETEIRTRRVVIEESDGFERLVASASDGYGHVTVSGRTGSASATCVELFANDPIGTTGAHVGVSLTDNDEVVAVFEAVEGRRPRMWVADEDDETEERG